MKKTFVLLVLITVLTSIFSCGPRRYGCGPNRRCNIDKKAIDFDHYKFPTLVFIV